MALIACAECGKKVSDMAKACNECGFPIGDYVAYERATNQANALAEAIAEVALRPDKSGGKVLIAEEYGDLQIVVKNRLSVFELIVNGVVVGEFKGLLAVGVNVEANIGNIHIKATMSGLTGSSKLFVNGSLVAKGKMQLI